MTFIRFSSARCRLALVAAGIMALGLPPLAAAQGPAEDRGPETAPGLNRELLPAPANRDHPEDDGASLGRKVLLSGLRADIYESFLRFANFGRSAGSAQVTLFDADTGDEVVTWDSAVIPEHGALQVSLTDITGDLVVEDEDRFVAVVRATFKGHVQHVAWSADDGVLSDLTSCHKLVTPRRALGYVAGPGATPLAGALHIVNMGPQTRAVELAVRDAETGGVIGTWTSPDIAGHGALEIPIEDLAADASTPVDPDTVALTVSVEGRAPLISLAYVEGVADGAVTDLTAGCALRGGERNEASGDDGDGDDDDDDEDEGEDEGDDSED